MSNSIGNLKNSGLQGNNFPWQLKMLEGLQAIYNEVKKPLTCVEDGVTICGPTDGLNVNLHDGSGTPITSTPDLLGNTGIDVNIIGGVTLEVNLDPDNDSVGMYGYTDINDPLNPTAILVNSSGQLDIRPLTCADTVSLCFNDGVSDVTVSSTNPFPVNAVVTVPTPLPVSQDPTSNPWTVDATDLDIRDLTFATDSVDVTGSDVTVSNTVDVTATDLDIRDLTFATDSVDVSGSNVNAVVTATALDIRPLDCGTDSIKICDGTTDLGINLDGSINTQSSTLDGSGNAITSVLSGSRRGLDVNILTPNIAVALDSIVETGSTGDLSLFSGSITSISFQNIGSAVATVSVNGGSTYFPVAPGTSINLDPRIPMGYYDGTSFFWDTTTVGASLLIIYNYI